jgi:uncharacterized repeat protein (TIGR01451 family)
MNGAGNDIAADCSAYIAARPFLTYGQVPGDNPYLSGAAYNYDCFTLGACWRSSPFNSVIGDGSSNVPWVEYDFTPTWTTTTYIWIRASGGGEESYTWAGPNPDQIQPDLNGGGVNNNVVPWRKVIYWQVGNGSVNQRKDNMNADYQNQTDDNSRHFQIATSWRDNRAENARWRWIKLGSTATVSDTQYTLKLYQGSAGYKVDKIVFTNDSSGATPEAGSAGPAIPTVLRRRADGSTAPSDGGAALGPPASPGSATREACNVCNPAFGYTVNPNECSCKLTATDTANDGYGSGLGCSLVATTTNQLSNDLYSGLQPLRSAQESVKNLARKLNPQCDQLGFVAFTAGSDNDSAQGDGTRRSKLQCLNWASAWLGNTGRCYDPGLGTPLSYTNIISAVERNWPEGGTNIAIGLREGLEELGIDTDGVGGQMVTNNCTTSNNDGNACSRGGAAKRILILVTDGQPNANPGNCAPGGGRPDLWDGLVGTEDTDFECSVYYAYLAAQNNITFYTIGIGGGANSDLLTTMATGVDPRGDNPDVVMFSGASGQFFPAAKPSDLEAIFDTLVAPSANCQPSATALALTKTDTSDPVAASELLTYTLTVTNDGSLNAFGVVITDALDSNVSFASASDGGLHDAGVVTWNVGVILPSQTVTRTLAVTVENFAGAVVTNTAWVTSSEGISHTAIATTTIINGEQIWALNYRVAQGENLPVHLENHFSMAGPYDIYLSDGSNLFKVCEAVNTSPVTNSGDFSCNVGPIPPGFYDLFSTLAGTTTPLAVAPQQVEVTISPPQIQVDNGASGNIAAFSSTITVSLVAHQIAAQPFDVSLVYGAGLSRTITSSISAAPGPITWRIPGDLGNPCPPAGGSPCLIQSRRVSDPAIVYAATELYLNQPQILLAGGIMVYVEGDIISIFLGGHTPGLPYDLKFSDGGANTIWLGRTGLTDANGDTSTPVTWTVPVGWPNGFYTITSHPAVGGTPRDPASMTSDNQVGSLGNVQIDTPPTCTDPLAEKSFEPPPLTHWVLSSAEGVTVTPGSAHSGNFKLSAPSFNGQFRQPFFYQPFTVPTSIISSATHLKLSLFKNINNLSNGDEPDDRFDAIVTTGPSLSSTQVTFPVEVANGVMGAASYNPSDWQAVNVLLRPASGVNLADYLGQNLYLYFYNQSNVSCVPTPPSTGCYATQFHFDDVGLDVCSSDLPVLNLPPSNPSPAHAGSLFTYTLTVANNGSADATGVVMSDALDNRVTFAAASDGGQHNAGLVTWHIGSLPISQTITRTVAVTIGNVISGTILSHTLLVTSIEGISDTRIITTTVLSSSTSSSNRFIYLPTILKN